MPEIQVEELRARVEALPGTDRLREAASGRRAFLVGGVVRDLLLGRDRADLDLVVEGDVAPVAARLGGAVRAHERFGTATVRVDGLELDLATARAETYARPGALPEVRAAELEADLARRDFTINAMAVPLERPGELIDLHGGVEDLRAGRLRVLHEGSFEDDPTRALRAARYAARYGFHLEAATAERLRAADMGSVSAERVEAELRKLAAEPDPAPGLELLGEWGLVPLAPNAAELARRVTELLGSEPWRGIAEQADAVLAAVSGPPGSSAELTAEHPERASAAVALAHGRSGPELVVARALGAQWLDPYVERWRDVRLEISGEDLLAAGVEEGPAIGRGLRAALGAKLDGEVSGREDELRLALAAARAPAAE